MRLADLALRRELAMLDAESGLIREAESQLDEVIRQLRGLSEAATRYELGRALLDRATVLSTANRWDDALADLDECGKVARQCLPVPQRSLMVNVHHQMLKLRTASNSPLSDMAAAHVELESLRGLGISGWWLDEAAASLAYKERDWALAAKAYQKVADQLAREGWERGAAASRLLAGRALLEQGDIHKSDSELTAALRFFEQFGPPPLLAAVRMSVARLRQAQGRSELAWELAQSAISCAESQIRRVRSLSDQQRFMQDKQELYQQAFAIGLATGGTEGPWRAWNIAERAKSAYLSQIVANADVALFDGISVADVARLKELEASLDECEVALGVPDSPDSTATERRRSELQDRLQVLSLEKAELQDRMMRANPRWGALRVPPPLDLAAEIRRFGSRWMFLSYYWQPDVDAARLHVFLASAATNLRRFEVAWSGDQLRQLRETGDRLRGGVLPGTPMQPLGLEASILPTEIAGLLSSDRAVLISPHGPLRFLPLHMLPIGGGERMFERTAVQYIPTLSLLPMRQATAREGPVLLIGSENNGFGDRALKEVPGEIAALEGIWSSNGGTSVTARLIGAQSSPLETGIALDTWEHYEVIHIACHGVFPEDRPFDAALRLGRDAVRASEFFHSRLTARVVALSACAVGRHARQTPDLNVGSSDEWIGLCLPLFYSGARAALVSLWNANSRLTPQIMKEFHFALSRRAPPHTAMQTALKSVSGKPEAIWANWVLVGVPD